MWKKVMAILFPASLKNRLFLAFILLILFPFSILNIYNFNKMEGVIKTKVSEQSQTEMDQMKRSLEEIINTSIRTFTLLEQDPNISDILQNPAKYDSYDSQNHLENKFKALTNSIFLTTSHVYFTILDMKGHFYTSYKPAEALGYDKLKRQDWYHQDIRGQTPYQWFLEVNYVHKDESPNPRLLTAVTSFKSPNGEVYAVVRLSIDYIDWFQSITYGASPGQDYFLASADGEIVAENRNAAQELNASAWDRIRRNASKEGFDLDRDSIVIYTYIPWLDWYLLKRVSTGVVFAETEQLKQSFFFSFILFTTAFVLITFFIAATITRPLKHLQVRMQQMVRKNLKVRLPEERYRGEMRQLTQTFNQMVSDMNGLVDRLRIEEREKEAVHFQMLLSQTNPHFLLNTLNTIKWIAIGKQDEEISEICLSLGRLLEASLNSEVELIYLKNEVELVDAYMVIQNFRYKQRFKVHFEIDEFLKYALVPKLSLQPLVENCIQHGFKLTKEEGEIRIRTYRSEDRLVVEVEDNGIGIAQTEALYQEVPSPRKRSGIGLSNLNKRLALLFKEKAGLDVQSSDHGTLVRYYLPLLLSEPYHKE
ncbi:sensor histidine kinase [Paenibacillus sp. URB8-2]|uniref:sensor histidine kinase n=1 Tax=Paenibacillus sp. URB8-2 TaxID=2741301 RepID=UPI0015B8E9B0|nr:sensor histidine kinase [Paenibacillus sp. URB8-2]BCG58030.1 histidine kinase [Paenibacillus sp. URB8-2]